MVDELLELAGDVPHRRAVAGAEQRGVVGLQPVQGLQVEAHVAVGRREDGHRAQAEDGVAGEQRALVAEVEGDGAEGVAGRIDGLDGEAAHLDGVAALQQAIGGGLGGGLAPGANALGDRLRLGGEVRVLGRGRPPLAEKACLRGVQADASAGGLAESAGAAAVVDVVVGDDDVRQLEAGDALEILQPIGESGLVGVAGIDEGAVAAVDDEVDVGGLRAGEDGLGRRYAVDARGYLHACRPLRGQC